MTDIRDRIMKHSREFTKNGQSPEPFYLSIDEYVEFMHSLDIPDPWISVVGPLRYGNVPILLKPPGIG